MKRSEMVKLLADALEYHDWKGEPDEMADHILNFLEQQGMQPPPVLHDSKLFGQLRYYEWEDEE